MTDSGPSGSRAVLTFPDRPQRRSLRPLEASVTIDDLAELLLVAFEAVAEARAEVEAARPKDDSP